MAVTHVFSSSKNKLHDSNPSEYPLLATGSGAEAGLFLPQEEKVPTPQNAKQVRNTWTLGFHDAESCAHMCQFNSEETEPPCDTLWIKTQVGRSPLGSSPGKALLDNQFTCTDRFWESWCPILHRSKSFLPSLNLRGCDTLPLQSTP